MINEKLIKLLPSRKLREKLRKQNKFSKKELNDKIFEQNQIASFLRDEYITPYLNGRSESFDLKPKVKFDNEKIIWQYWGQCVDENTPLIVRTCFDSIEKNKGDYTRIILTNDNICDYLDLPDFVFEKLKNNDEFTYTFFSDLLRISLLSVYGGVWADATIYLSGKIENKILNQDFFMFQRTQEPEKVKKQFWEFNPDYFSWDEKYRVNLLNSFIVAKKNHPIILALRNILFSYWKKEEHFKHYFLFQILFDELMQVEKFSKLNCEKVSDVLPHYMLINYNSPYSDELFNEITQKSNIHKLSYFQDFTHYSFFAKLLFDFQKPYDIYPKSENENITFCTMLFNLKSKNLDDIKKADRSFDTFYLKSLKSLIEKYKKVVLWCDEETANFLDENNIKVHKKVISFEELPHFDEKEENLKNLHKMKNKSFNEGYLLKDLEPETVIDYATLVHTKIEVIKWAKDNNFYNSDYFYWIDAGTNNPIFTRCWLNWDGIIEPETKKFKCCFMTEFKKMYKSIYEISTIEDIALIKAPFEIIAGMFLVYGGIVDEFYEKYHLACDFLQKQELFTTEQSVFSTMLKLYGTELFEFSKTENYIDVMNLVAKSKFDKFKNDRLRVFKKKFILFFAEVFLPQKQVNKIKQTKLYRKK